MQHIFFNSIIIKIHYYLLVDEFRAVDELTVIFTYRRVDCVTGSRRFDCRRFVCRPVDFRRFDMVSTTLLMMMAMTVMWKAAKRGRNSYHNKDLWQDMVGPVSLSLPLSFFPFSLKHAHTHTLSLPLTPFLPHAQFPFHLFSFYLSSNLVFSPVIYLCSRFRPF